MIFRRIKAHVAKENWFAVCIDFFIVVVGVFVGLQVSNWSAARADRVDDLLYMQRLHDEIERSDTKVAVILNELDITVSRLRELVDLVFGDRPVMPLTRDQCDAVFASHIYRPGRVSIPTLEELIASGRASIISDLPLRSAILHLSQLRRATDDFNGRISADAVELHRKYPQMILLNKELTYDRFGHAPYGGHQCFPEMMRESAGFRNDLVDNLYRMDSYLKLTYSPELTVLADIHTILDDILDIDHGGEAKP